MKLSMYNFYEICDGKALIYNSASGNCIVITEAEFLNFTELKTSNDNIQQFKELGFYVDDSINELQQLIDKAYSNLHNSKKDKYRVLTTTACNAKCSYCYEKGVSSYNMNNEVADKVANFILNRSKSKKIIEIEWFGGEPLLNTNAISYITEKILKQKSSDTIYEASIITNGYLLNVELIDTLISKWKIKRIQITLDGFGEVYESIKQLGEGSFIKIINNLKELSKYDIEIDVRLNYDENNIQYMEELISYLSSLTFKDKLYIYPAKINDNLRKNNFALENETIKMYNMLYSYKLISAQNLLPKTMKNPCAASKKDYFTINANGELFKCDRKLLAGNSVGTVFSECCFDTKKTPEWETISPEKKCIQCKIFPLCWGGCIYERLKKLDHCYITEKIINHNLHLILKDVKEYSN